MENVDWNDAKLRFDKIVEDVRPVNPGIPFDVDIDILISKVVISPYAPPWYFPMLETLKNQLNLSFEIVSSKLLDQPKVIP
jgi:hypothetical protein